MSQAKKLKSIRSFRQFLESEKSFTLTIELAFLRLPGLVALLIFSAPLGNALTMAMVHASITPAIAAAMVRS
ncbi:MAG: hypothetical protein WCQ57_00415 [Verrucomicrobiota bacterium]